MSTTIRNEAAERLHFLLGLQQQPNARKGQDDLDAALAAERRATVERIKQRLAEPRYVGWLEDGTEIYQRALVVAIMDEEATR